MTISLSCDTCGRSYQLKDEAAGRKIRCKDCETILTVPELKDQFEDYGDDPWGSSSSAGSKQDDFWNNDDDDWGDSAGSSGAYSAPAPYSVKSGGDFETSTSTRPPKPRKKKRSSSGSGNDTGALIGKIVGGVFVALVVLGLIVRVGGAIGKLGFGGSLSWQEFNPPGTPFSIQLPGKPTQGFQAQGGFTFTQHSVETRFPQQAFGIMHATMPFPPGTNRSFDDQEIQNILRESKQGMIQGVPGVQVHSERSTSVTDAGGNTHPGYELIVSMPYQGKQLKSMYRFFLVGNRLAILLAGAQVSDFDRCKPDFDKCMDSFRVTQPVTPISRVKGTAPNSEPVATNGNVFNAPSDNSQPPSYDPPPAGANPNPGGQFNNPAADISRRMREENERRMQESRERLEKLRRESEERRRAIQNRFRTP